MEHSNIPESKRKNTLIGIFDETTNHLLHRYFELIAYTSNKDVRYYDDFKNYSLVSAYKVNLDYTLTRLKSKIETIKQIYPQITEDDNFIKLCDLMKQNYIKDKGNFFFGFVVDNELLTNIAITIDPIRNKLKLAKGSIEDLENELFLLKKLEASEFLKPLISSKKSTEKLRHLISEMKNHIADGDTWKDYKNSFSRLNPELQTFPLPDHWKTSEKLVDGFNHRYITSNKLNEYDTQFCLELLNDMIDKLDSYDTVIET